MEYEHILLCYKLSSAMMTSINNQLRPYHLTFQQFFILSYLNEQEKDVVGRDICQYLGISHPTSVGLISRLQGAEYIVAEVSQEDRRERVIYLTEKGKQVVNESRHVIDDYIQTLTNHLSEQEQMDFMALLLKLNTILKIGKGK